MSVIAWDGKTLAADSIAINGDLKIQVSKIRTVIHAGEQIYLAWTGQLEHGYELIDWYLSGATKETYPGFQQTPDWTRLVVVKQLLDGDWQALAYEQTSFPIIQPAPFAWGSGRDFAFGAMAMGADACRAIEVACQFSPYCGLPVKSYKVCD